MTRPGDTDGFRVRFNSRFFFFFSFLPTVFKYRHYSAIGFRPRFGSYPGLLIFKRGEPRRFPTVSDTKFRPATVPRSDFRLRLRTPKKIRVHGTRPIRDSRAGVRNTDIFKFFFQNFGSGPRKRFAGRGEKAERSAKSRTAFVRQRQKVEPGKRRGNRILFDIFPFERFDKNVEKRSPNR